MKRISEIIKRLKSYYKIKEYKPTHYNSKNLYELLISTILSQRNKDKNTEKISKEFFSKFKNIKEVYKAPLKDIEESLRKTGIYKIKAKYIKETTKIVLEKYKGKIPNSKEELMKLPGVGPKTAGIVLVYGFGQKVAIPVDTHVHRISNRIGIVHTKTPEKTEIELMKIIPKKYWRMYNILFVTHGQKLCSAKNPKCNKCPISEFCDYKRKCFKFCKKE